MILNRFFLLTLISRTHVFIVVLFFYYYYLYFILDSPRGFVASPLTLAVTQSCCQADNVFVTVRQCDTVCSFLGGGGEKNNCHYFVLIVIVILFFLLFVSKCSVCVGDL